MFGMSKILQGLVLTFVALFWLPVAVWAHGLHVFGWVEGDTGHVESYFSQTKRAAHARVEVYDMNEKMLLAGTTDARGNFSFPGGAQGVLDSVDCLIHFFDADWTFLQRFDQTGTKLIFIEWLTVTILFDNARHHQLSGFISRKALGAGDTFTPAPYLITLSHQT